ncbi:MAG: sodium/solute symporter [Ignavibacteriaceae bacterium]|nr:sodium/solute symporter [Ignavibacteriaceae bacterium]
MSLELIDYLIIGIYLLIVAVWGIISGGKQEKSKDYFLGKKKVHFTVSAFSIIAAETSTLTFISIPGLAYLTNLGFIQITIGYLIGRIIVTRLLLPEYFKGELSTAYSFLERRFGKKMRTAAGSVFIFTRLAADGVRLFATAIPVKLILGIDYHYAIMLVALVSLLYTYTGGIRGVIWVDTLQMFIYLGGAFLALFFIISGYDEGAGVLFAKAAKAGKLQYFNWGFEGGFEGFITQPYTFLGGIIGGTFLSMASHGIDQLIIQRVLATGDLKAGQKSLILSGVIVIFQFLLFLMIGALLYVVFEGKQFGKPDEVFPFYIIHYLPSGAKGIIIAGLLAAAMSTIAGSVSSLTSSLILDIMIPYSQKKFTEDVIFKLTKFFTVMWAVLLVFSAFFFMNTHKAVVEIALSIASFTYGGLLGTFLLGKFVSKARQEDALAGFFAGIFLMVAVISLKLTAWTWFTLTGVTVTMLTGFILSRLNNEKKETD